MTVLDERPTVTTSGYTPRDADYLALTPTHRDLVIRTLRDLGINDAGYTVDTGIPTPDHRAAISATTARTIGMHLAAGHEIALCVDCLTINDAHHMREGADGGWRCDDDTDPFGNSCAQAHAAAYERD